MLLRVTGRVLVVEPKRGTKLDKESGVMREWTSTTVRVLVANRDLVEWTVFDAANREAYVPPVEGSEIDFAVDVSIRKNAQTGVVSQEIRPVRPWADLVTPRIAAHKAA